MPKITHTKTPVLKLIHHLEAEGFKVVMTQQLTDNDEWVSGQKQPPRWHIGWRILFFNERLEIQTLDASRQAGDLKALGFDD